MNVLKKSLTIISFATIAAIIITAPIFASIKDCIPSEKYPNLSTESSDDFPVKCVRVKEGGDYITIYAKTSADCAQASNVVRNPDICEEIKETTQSSKPSVPSTTKEAAEETKTNNNNSGAIGFIVVGTFCGIILIITIIVGVRWFRNLKKDIPEMIQAIQEPDQNGSASGQDFHMVEQPQNPQDPQTPQGPQNPTPFNQ
jgi:hypothetical protein